MKDRNELRSGYHQACQIDEVAASLAILNNAPSDMKVRPMEDPVRPDPYSRKSAGLNRPAVEAILCNSPLQQPRALPPEDRREGAGFMAAW